MNIYSSKKMDISIFLRTSTRPRLFNRVLRNALLSFLVSLFEQTRAVQEFIMIYNI